MRNRPVRQGGAAIGWVLGGLAVLAVLVVGALIAMFFWVSGVLKQEMRAALDADPTVQAQLGPVRGIDIEVTATGQAQGDNVFVLSVEGERASGTVTAEFLTGRDGKSLGRGELVTEDGRRFALGSSVGEAVDEVDFAVEEAVERFLRNAADAIHAHPTVREHLGLVDDVQLDEDASANEPGPTTFVFNLGGSAGRGVLTAELETIDEHTERLGAGRLVLEDGTVVELNGGE